MWESAVASPDARARRPGKGLRPLHSLLSWQNAHHRCPLPPAGKGLRPLHSLLSNMASVDYQRFAAGKGLRPLHSLLSSYDSS